MTNPDQPNLPPDMAQIHKLICDTFNLDELQTLCLDFQINYENLGGDTLNAKSRELLLTMKRTKRMPALLDALERMRSDEDWRGGPVAEVACPYKGLHAFHEVDANNFFGREAFTDEIVSAVAESSLVAVVGPSGSGKSSVVFAGLVPQLRTHGQWLIADFRPGSDPFRALAQTLLPLIDPNISKINQPVESRQLAANLESGKATLADYLQIIHDENPAAQLLLICDQFEELYTQGIEREMRHRFLDRLLASFAEESQTIAKLVLTLRADFMGHVLAYPPMVAALQKKDIKIGLMARPELEMTIVQPANNVGVGFEEGLVTRILDDVGEHVGNLPLLEFALTLLWEKQRGGQMTHTAYEEIGGVAGALAQHADNTLAQLTRDNPALEEEIQRVMVQLVHPGAGAEDTRRIARRDEFGANDWAVVPQLADARLLVTARENDDADAPETVEVIHEALIQNWGRLQTWMETDREFRMWQERLRADLRLWQENEQQDGFLLQGAPLALAEDWQKKRSHDLSTLEFEYIDTSVQKKEAREAKSKKQRQRAIIGLGTGLVIFALLTVGLFTSNQSAQGNLALAEAQTRLAEARALAAEANQLLDRKELNKGLVKAYQAVRATYDQDGTITDEANFVMHNALKQTRPRHVLEGHTGIVNSAIFNHDGTRIVTASDDGTARLWDGEGALIATLEGHTSWVKSAAFNHDGTRIVTASRDGTARLWDGDGTLITSLEGHTDWVELAVFNHDGTRIVTASLDNTARLWDGDGNLITPLEGHTNNVRSAAFNHDGTRIVTASEDDTARLWDGWGWDLDYYPWRGY